MKRVTVFVGSGRKGYTLQASQQLLANLEALGDVEGEIVALGDYCLETCIGCKQCFERGEERCPQDDDRDLLLAKIDASAAVVMATPTYAFHVSGLTKTFLDRLSYVLHRPRYFGKTFTSIVTQGIYGGGKVVGYLDFVANALGFSTVKGCCVTTLEPMTPKAQHAFDKALVRLARRLDRAMNKPAFPRPGLMPLIIFRMSRTKIRVMLDERNADWRYYRDQGWFTSGFYYPTRLGPLRKAVGWLVDRATAAPAGGGEATSS